MGVPAQATRTAIGQDIVSGAHERGSRLTEGQLARRYGVSRVPVREALRTLEARHLLAGRPLSSAGMCRAAGSRDR
ncbi:GntR family transcriptional regulator [Streptomyces sp. SID8014]|uniref:GntR family transcriptional regulator n=1 Tax=Streptomyces sp. SID8014 TaxID=2706097 RepID=UPI0023B2DC4D|nr:GntR family transcriptional regulator [Streptomyces sp. SID8014]